MKLIVITPESHFEGESDVLNSLFEAGLETLHLRHPWASEDEIRAILEGVEQRFLGRIVLHDGVESAAEFGVAGVHLNRRNPAPPTVPGGAAIRAVSRSCHSFEELQRSENKGLDYVFLSPVFDSISKSGYGSAFTPEQLRQARKNGTINGHVVALGGVSAEKIEAAAEFGFGGVAVLGAVWGCGRGGGFAPEAVIKNFQKLHGITLHIS